MTLEKLKNKHEHDIKNTSIEICRVLLGAWAKTQSWKENEKKLVSGIYLKELIIRL